MHLPPDIAHSVDHATAFVDLFTSNVIISLMAVLITLLTEEVRLRTRFTSNVIVFDGSVDHAI